MAGPYEGVTEETLREMVQKAATGIYANSGMTGVDLSGRVSLIPVNVPARNNTGAFPRVIPKEGDTLARWRAWLNVNSSQYSAAVGPDYPGSQTLFSEQNCFAPYMPLSKFGRVTLEGLAFARNYDDALADAELQALMQLFIGQDMAIINHQGWALPSMGTITLATATTGGSIAASTTVYVAVAARSGANYFEGGSGPASSSTALSLETGSGTSTNTITATWAAVKGAVAYDVYVGSSSGASNLWYYTTVTTGSVTITSVPTAAAALPTLPLLSTLAPGSGVAPLAQPPTAGNGHPPSSDTSYSSTNYYNGVMAAVLGDYGTTGPVTPGSGTATGATWIDNGGATLALSGGGISLLDTINDDLWASVQLSPTAYMVNSLQGDEISKLIVGSNSATTFLPPTDADARTNLAGGGFIGRYVNRAAGGVPVSIEVHPRVAPGTIIARTDRVPFPGSNIGSAFEVRCQYDSMRFDYAASVNLGTQYGGPRYDFEIRSLETLISYAPAAQAVAVNVG